MSNLLTTISPDDIDASKGFFSTVWQNSEKETIACNIVLISKWGGNKWEPFTWEEYKKRCRHKVTDSEKAVLDSFVEEGYLTLTDGKYMVTKRFIAALSEYVKE